MLDDESACCFNEGIDKSNGCIFSYFVSYIDELAQEFRLMNVPDKHNEFETINYVIKIKDIYIEIGTMVGQGSISYASICEKPKFLFLDLNNIVDCED